MDDDLLIQLSVLISTLEFLAKITYAQYWADETAWKGSDERARARYIRETDLHHSAHSDRAFALRIVGDCTQASDGVSFSHGSTIAVELNQVVRNGSYVVIRLESSRRILKPLNPRYPIMEVAEVTQICGGVRQMVIDFDR